MGTGTHKGMAAIGRWAAVAGVCAVLGGSAFGQASFEVLTETLGAYDATDDARTLVGTSFDGEDCSFTYDNASMWTQATGWKWLEGVCGDFIWTSEARATSRTGDVIAGTASDNRGYLQFIFIWTGPGQVRELWNPEVDPHWMFNGMSRDGRTIAATAHDDITFGPMRWTEEKSWEKLLLDGQWLYGGATDAADDGTVVGYADSIAVRWAPDGEGITLPPPAGLTDCTPSVVTSNGRFVFGESREFLGSTSHLTRWTPKGTSQEFGSMPYGSAMRSVYPSAASTDGNQAVGSWILDGTSNEPAFIWNARDGIRDLREVLVSDYGLDVGEFRVKNPVMMSEDGRRIVGSEDFSGEFFAKVWRVTLPAYCHPDCNADGALTINDFLCFQARWRAQDIYGDFNNDAKFNINDYIAFQAEWRRLKDGGGCE